MIQETEVQVAGLSPKVPRHSRRHLQRLQCPAPPDPPTDPSPIPSRGDDDLGGCYLGRVIVGTASISLRLPLVNVTTPAEHRPLFESLHFGLLTILSEKSVTRLEISASFLV